MKIKLAYAIAAATLVLAGCQQGEPMAATPAQQPAAAPAAPVAPVVSALPGRAAVFDIDYVADQTGMVQAMQKKIEAKKEELKKDLDDFSKKLQSKLQEEGKKLKKDKNLKKKALALERATGIKFRQGKAEADAVLNAYRINLIGEIRDTIKPIARQVAFGKGFDILLLRNDTVVYEMKDEVELTKEILSAYQAKFPEAVKKPEPAPKAKKKSSKKEAKK